jgi:hypothetical protein
MSPHFINRATTWASVCLIAASHGQICLASHRCIARPTARPAASTCYFLNLPRRPLRGPHHSPDISEILRLLGRLGGEALMHGVYDARATACLRAIFEVNEFVKDGSLLRQLRVNPRNDAAVGWFLLRLANSDDSADIREHRQVLDLVQHLSRSTQPGAAVISKKLATVFASPGASKAGFDAAGAASLEDAEAIVPPGMRKHDNDKPNFRDIAIYPSPPISCERI